MIDYSYKYFKYKQKFFKLKQDGGECKNIKTDNCWVINAHGYELDDDFILPPNITIDYFVKSGDCLMFTVPKAPEQSYMDEYCKNYNHISYKPFETIISTPNTKIKEMIFGPDEDELDITYYSNCNDVSTKK